MGTDVPRPDFNDGSLDKGTKIGAKDGNWFYIEFYGDDELFGELVAALQDVDAMQSEHQLKGTVFVEAMRLWIESKKEEAMEMPEYNNPTAAPPAPVEGGNPTEEEDPAQSLINDLLDVHEHFPCCAMYASMRGDRRSPRKT
jgi:hypothetical protein